MQNWNRKVKLFDHKPILSKEYSPVTLSASLPTWEVFQPLWEPLQSSLRTGSGILWGCVVYNVIYWFPAGWVRKSRDFIGNKPLAVCVEAGLSSCRFCEVTKVPGFLTDRCFGYSLSFPLKSFTPFLRTKSRGALKKWNECCPMLPVYSYRSSIYGVFSLTAGWNKWFYVQHWRTLHSQIRARSSSMTEELSASCAIPLSASFHWSATSLLTIKSLSVQRINIFNRR